MSGGHHHAHDGHGHGHRHGHDHGHAHVLAPGRFDRAVAIAVGLNAAFVAIEVAAGTRAGSLALLADAGHNAGDVAGLLFAWGANWLARRPPSRRYTWGLRRSTIYAALANAMLLLAACGAIAWEAAGRLRHPAPVAGFTVIAVAAAGVVLNTLTALLFVRGRRDANVRGAFLHMAADAAVSAGVVAAGIAIACTGRAWIDPVVSLAIAAVIVWGTWGLFREAIDLALDAVPRGVDPAAIEAALAGLPGVTEVHDLHVWGASTSEVSLTAHLIVPQETDRDAVLAAALASLREQFRVDHATIQIEGAAAGAACPQRPTDAL
ncbi:MAG: cation diffusion facilitator family transporter [Planctomycetaceae bacterium]